MSDVRSQSAHRSWFSIGVGIALVSGCTGGADVSAPVTTLPTDTVATSESTAPTAPRTVEPSVATAPPGFCEVGRRAVAGNMELTSVEGAAELIEHPGLAADVRARLAAAVREIAPAVISGGGFDTTPIADVVNELCEPDLRGQQMVP